MKEFNRMHQVTVTWLLFRASPEHHTAPRHSSARNNFWVYHMCRGVLCLSCQSPAVEIALPFIYHILSMNIFPVRWCGTGQYLGRLHAFRTAAPPNCRFWPGSVVFTIAFVYSIFWNNASRKTRHCYQKVFRGCPYTYAFLLNVR